MRMPSKAAGDGDPSQATRPASARGWLGRAARLAHSGQELACRHWIMTVLLAAGLVMRVLAQIAYRPALVYIDSIKYLLGAYPGDDPPGYLLALKPLLVVGNLDVIVAVQHLLGLAMAVTIYAVLLRRGVPRWLAALATAPVLLDGYQLQIEQNIMPDVMFETLIVAGVALLLWHLQPRPWMVVVAGLSLGASSTARQVGEILILPAVVYLLIVLGNWRQRLQQAVLLAVAFSLPIMFASYKEYVSIHRFGLAPYASGSIFGRMAEAADCATLKLPATEHGLCPTEQQKKLLGPDGLDHNVASPIRGFSGDEVRAFEHQVLEQQPFNVALSVGKDAMKLFALTRNTSPGDTPISRWQFQASYPQYPPYVVIQNGVIVFGNFNHFGAERTLGTAEQFGGGSPTVIKPLAAFLRAYQLDGGYTPGPLFLFTALAGLAGSLAALRRRASPRQRNAARACLLFYTAGVGALLSSDVFEFSWRYQLPALITLMPATALALTVLLDRRLRPAGSAAVTGPGPAFSRPSPASQPVTADGQPAPANGQSRAPAGQQPKDRAPAS
jgi:Dolichyl-phosphate-mannose-protein mannosyltransferase